MTHDQIAAICRTHGAKRVSDAAYAAMEGRRGALQAIGLDGVVGLGPLHEITVVAYKLMSDDDQGADAAQACIDLAKRGL